MTANLPPLPAPLSLSMLSTSRDLRYTAENMLTYGEACAAAAVKAERERCAALADEYATWGGSTFAAWFYKLAAAIRGGE